MAYVTIPNTDVDQDSPITVALMTALRDNLEAVVDGDAGSPILGLTKLSSATLSNAATVDFTTFDPTRYESYIFTFSNVVPVNSLVDLLMRTSTDGGSSFDAGTNYRWSITTDVTLDNNGGAAATSLSIALAVPNTAALGCSGSLDLYAPDTTDQTFTTGRFAVGSGAETVMSAGLHAVAADVDAVRFLFSGGNLSTGTITMYGRAI